MRVFIVLLFCITAQCFKLPSVDLETNISKKHDTFQKSIVNSTVTTTTLSPNLTVVHLSCSILLLVLIMLSYRKLSILILELSIQVRELSHECQGAKQVCD